MPKLFPAGKGKKTTRSSSQKAAMKENYKKLREAGYSPQEASRLRSAAKSTIDKALHTTPGLFRNAKPVSARHQKAGGSSGAKRISKRPNYTPAPPLEYPPHKGRIKNSDYKSETPEGYNYENEWAYRMSYVTVDITGFEQRKYFTILPDEKMTKKELIDFVYQVSQEKDNSSRYQAKVIKSSIVLIGAYHFYM